MYSWTSRSLKVSVRVRVACTVSCIFSTEVTGGRLELAMIHACEGWLCTCENVRWCVAGARCRVGCATLCFEGVKLFFLRLNTIIDLKNDIIFKKKAFQRDSGIQPFPARLDFVSVQSLLTFTPRYRRGVTPCCHVGPRCARRLFLSVLAFISCFIPQSACSSPAHTSLSHSICTRHFAVDRDSSRCNLIFFAKSLPAHRALCPGKIHASGQGFLHLHSRSLHTSLWPLQTFLRDMKRVVVSCEYTLLVWRGQQVVQSLSISIEKSTPDLAPSTNP